MKNKAKEVTQLREYGKNSTNEYFYEIYSIKKYAWFPTSITGEWIWRKPYYVICTHFDPWMYGDGRHISRRYKYVNEEEYSYHLMAGTYDEENT
jgi:hypothetical protein